VSQVVRTARNLLAANRILGMAEGGENRLLLCRYIHFVQKFVIHLQPQRI
jgi:hypothetical protein